MTDQPQEDRDEALRAQLARLETHAESLKRSAASIAASVAQIKARLDSSGS